MTQKPKETDPWIDPMTKSQIWDYKEYIGIQDWEDRIWESAGIRILRDRQRT